MYFIYRTVRNINNLRNKIKVEKQLTEYKLVFFTNISHEFRTPLTLIRGALDRIHRNHNIPKDILYSIKLMDKSTQRMLRLINQLLEFRKMQNNKLALSLEETDIIAFLYEIYLSFQDTAESKTWISSFYLLSVLIKCILIKVMWIKLPTTYCQMHLNILLPAAKWNFILQLTILTSNSLLKLPTPVSAYLKINGMSYSNALCKVVSPVTA